MSNPRACPSRPALPTSEVGATWIPHLILTVFPLVGPTNPSIDRSGLTIGYGVEQYIGQLTDPVLSRWPKNGTAQGLQLSWIDYLDQVVRCPFQSGISSDQPAVGQFR